MSGRASKKVTPKEASDAAKALEALFASEYVSRKKLFIANFWRGVFFSAGTIVGAVVILTVLLWALSLFERVPLVGPITNNIQQTVEKQKSSK